MSEKLPPISADKLAKILRKLGFEEKRQHGSHMVFEHEDGRVTVVPRHPGQEIREGLLDDIIKHEIGMSRKEFLEYL